jgi:hypothetical protein
MALSFSLKGFAPTTALQEENPFCDARVSLLKHSRRTRKARETFFVTA